MILRFQLCFHFLIHVMNIQSMPNKLFSVRLTLTNLPGYILVFLFYPLCRLTCTYPFPYGPLSLLLSFWTATVNKLFPSVSRSDHWELQTRLFTFPCVFLNDPICMHIFLIGPLYYGIRPFFRSALELNQLFC